MFILWTFTERPFPATPCIMGRREIQETRLHCCDRCLWGHQCPSHKCPDPTLPGQDMMGPLYPGAEDGLRTGREGWGCVILFFKFTFALKRWVIYLFIYWLCWVFVSVRGLSLVAASGGHSSSQCAGLSPSRSLLLWSTGSRRAGSVVVAHRLSCSAACGIFPDQGSNPCPLHWQADSQPLRHQGSPKRWFWFTKSSGKTGHSVFQ